MFKVNVTYINELRHLAQRTAVFDQPQVVRFAAGDAEIDSITLEPNGCLFLNGKRAGKKKREKFSLSGPMVRRNSNVDYAAAYLQKLAREQALPDNNGGQRASEPAPYPPNAGFAFLA